MITLIIQTIFDRADLILLRDDKVINSKSWKSQRDEIKTILPAIENLLKEEGLEFFDLKRIVITVGIGNFSATRIGVTIGNTLAKTINSDIFSLKLEEEISTEELIKLVIEKFKNNWQKVDLAIPEYRSEPMISQSKKKKFT